MAGEQQFLRHFRLIVQKDGQEAAALDLSDFRVKFTITQATTARPCTAEVTVYNVSSSVVNAINIGHRRTAEGAKLKMIIEAGYKEKYAVIFQGDLWWKSTGRESETDTFMRLIASVGDSAHQYAVVNVSLPAGSTQADVFSAIAQSMSPYDVQVAEEPPLMENSLTRGKVLYMMSRDAMQNIADTNGFDWVYSTRGLIAIPKEGRLNSEKRAIVLQPGSGMLERPEITPDGLKVRALLNPDLEYGNVIQIDPNTVQVKDYSTAYSDVMQQSVATEESCSAQGLYKILSRTFVGDTRGDDWYADLVCVAYNPNTDSTHGWTTGEIWNNVNNLK